MLSRRYADLLIPELERDKLEVGAYIPEVLRYKNTIYGIIMLHPGRAQGESGARGENREHASAIWNIRSRDQSRGQSRFSPDLSPEY